MLSPGGRPGYNSGPLSQSKSDNWVARAGGLPGYIRGVARGVAKSHGGVVTSRDIQVAIARVKLWAVTSKNPSVKAAAAAALAQWEAMRAKSRLR